MIIQFFKLKIKNLKLKFSNDKEYRTIVHNKLADYISLLGGEIYNREIITISYYQKSKYNLSSLKQGRLKLIIIKKLNLIYLPLVKIDSKKLSLSIEI